MGDGGQSRRGQGVPAVAGRQFRRHDHAQGIADEGRAERVGEAAGRYDPHHRLGAPVRGGVGGQFGQVQADVRVRRLEAGQTGDQPFHRETGVDGDMQVLAAAAGPADGRGDLVEGLGEGRQQVAAGGGEFQPVLGSGEQAHAERPLQRLHLPAHGGVGDVKLLGRQGHPPVPSGGLERPQGVEGGQRSGCEIFEHIGSNKSISAKRQFRHKLNMEPDPPVQPLAPVDYDRVQHPTYAQGRALPADALEAYMAAFGPHLADRRPLVGLDLGSGTGRFTPSLAEAFGGPIYGVEPAEGMRRIAQAESRHPAVSYLAGRAEAIPLPDATADFVLMFLSWHHVTDKPAAAREIRRVLKPDGRLLLRSTFQDRIPDIWWRSYFPRSWDVERAMFPTVAETRTLFGAAGFRQIAAARMELPFRGDIAAAVARLKLRPYSVFEHMSEAELGEGFARMDADLAAGVIVEKPAHGDIIVFAPSGPCG